MAKPDIARMSLAQHFAAPDEYVGEFGWLCGYSADEAFMGIAAERFSTENAAARASSGCRRLGLLLDPGNPQLTSAAVPGVMHFPVKRRDLPFLLLHAKVAVLGFRRPDNPREWQLRVLVSTGNWTRVTLEGNIDLAWRVDIDSRALDNTTAGDCADLAAAWDMLMWLRGFFDTRILDALPAGRSDTETQLAQQNLERWVGQAAAKAQGTPRFIDNRGQSLWAHVQRKVKSSKKAPRNYLAMGSAYYQGANGAQLPSVLQAVVTGLQDAKLLTGSAGVDVYVNPEACQAVAPATPAIAAKGWTVRPPRKQGGQAFMHAKFVFSAKYLEASNKCVNPWLYFGSGNLTGPGFLKKASAAAGNLEAGVVLLPEHLLWEQMPGTDPADVVENLLPMQWTQDATLAGALQQGEEMADRDGQFVAPPLAWLMWQGDGPQAGWLVIPDNTDAPFELLDSSGVPCVRDATARIRWQSAQPVQVGVRWLVDDMEYSAQVPVIDEQGAIGAAPARPLGLDEVGWELVNFPALPAEDDPGTIDCPGAPSTMPDEPQILPGWKGSLQYPIRMMMQQLEMIADIQCSVDPLDWRAWCNRLEQVLCRAGASVGVAAFRALGIDPLSALRAPAFRPAYAETDQTGEGKRYEETLTRIALAWKVNELVALGEDA
jgi:hypothetical protein